MIGAIVNSVRTFKGGAVSGTVAPTSFLQCTPPLNINPAGGNEMRDLAVHRPKPPANYRGQNEL